MCGICQKETALRLPDNLTSPLPCKQFVGSADKDKATALEMIGRCWYLQGSRAVLLQHTHEEKHFEAYEHL